MKGHVIGMWIKQVCYASGSVAGNDGDYNDADFAERFSLSWTSKQMEYDFQVLINGSDILTQVR